MSIVLPSWTPGCKTEAEKLEEACYAVNGTYNNNNNTCDKDTSDKSSYNNEFCKADAYLYDGKCYSTIDGSPVDGQRTEATNGAEQQVIDCNQYANRYWNPNTNSCQAYNLDESSSEQDSRVREQAACDASSSTYWRDSSQTCEPYVGNSSGPSLDSSNEQVTCDAASNTYWKYSSQTCEPYITSLDSATEQDSRSGEQAACDASPTTMWDENTQFCLPYNGSLDNEPQMAA
jgi:hypothetical protein